MTPDPSERASAAAETIDAAAARWLARREAGLDPAGTIALRAWLAADPRHSAALARLDPHASPLDWPLRQGAADRVLAGLEQRARRRRARRRRTALAGVLALGLLGGAWALNPGLLREAAPGGTLIVQAPREQTLPDGSHVELDEHAEFRLAFTPEARRVELVRGSAHFTVRENPRRPFLVTAGGVTARAVGTAFLVGLEAGQVALVVTEGKVALDPVPPAAVAAVGAPPAPPLALVRAGESVTVDQAAGVARVTPLAADEARGRLAWRAPRLEFNGTALRDVLDRMNRHNREQLVLADASLGSLRLSGTLRADRIEALLEMLEADFGFSATRAGGTVVLRRGPR